MKYLLVSLLGVIVLVSGCERANEDILFSVDGKPFTQTMLNDQAELQLLMRQARKTVTDEVKIAQARKNLKSGILKNQIPTMLIVREAVASGAKVTRDERGAAEGTYAMRIGKRPEEFYVLRKMAQEKGLGDALNAKLQNELTANAYLQKAFSNELCVTDALVEKTIADMRLGDARANATNAIIYAQATNLWQRAVKGEDFAKLADAYSQEQGRDPGGDMGDSVKQVDFSTEAVGVWNRIAKLPKGGVTPPTDTSEGLMIFKCLDRKDSGEDGPTLHLARIVLYRALIYENYDKAFVRRSLAQDMRGKVLQRILDRQIAKTEIVFTPLGEKTLPKAYVNGWKKKFDEAHGRAANSDMKEKAE